MHASFLHPGFSPLFCFMFSCMQVLSQIRGVASKNKSWLLPYLKLVPRFSPSNPLRISPRETPAKVGLCHAQKPFLAVLFIPDYILCTMLRFDIMHWKQIVFTSTIFFSKVSVLKCCCCLLAECVVHFSILFVSENLFPSAMYLPSVVDIIWR